MVVGHALSERGEVLTVKAPGRPAAHRLRLSLVETHAHLARDLLLGLLREGRQRLPQRGEPQPVVDELRVAHGDRLLEVEGVAVEHEPFELAVGEMEHGSRRRLVDAARLDADQAVLHEIEPPHAVRAGHPVQRLDHLDRAEPPSVERDRDTPFEGEGDLLGLVRGVERIDGQLEHALLGAVPDVLEVAAFVGEVPQVAVAAEEVLRGVLHRNAFFLRVLEGVLA